jgi:hypothetical protein
MFREPVCGEEVRKCLWPKSPEKDNNGKYFPPVLLIAQAAQYRRQ